MFVSAAHGEDDIAQTIDTAAKAFTEAARLMP